MDLWIRSKNKEFLMKVDNINLGIDVDTNEPNRLFTFVGGAITSFTLGTYKTKERALEILDEIQELLEPVNVVEVSKKEAVIGANILYEMPEE